MILRVSASALAVTIQLFKIKILASFSEEKEKPSLNKLSII